MTTKGNEPQASGGSEALSLAERLMRLLIAQGFIRFGTRSSDLRDAIAGVLAAPAEPPGCRDMYCTYCGKTDHPSAEHPHIPGPSPCPQFFSCCGVEIQRSVGGAIAYGKHKADCPRGAEPEPDLRARARNWLRSYSEVGPLECIPCGVIHAGHCPKEDGIVESHAAFAAHILADHARPPSPSPALGVRELAKVLRDAWNTGDKGTWVNVAEAALKALKPAGVPSAEELAQRMREIGTREFTHPIHDISDAALERLALAALAALGQQEGKIREALDQLLVKLRMIEAGSSPTYTELLQAARDYCDLNLGARYQVVLPSGVILHASDGFVLDSLISAKAVRQYQPRQVKIKLV